MAVGSSAAGSRTVKVRFTSDESDLVRGSKAGGKAIEDMGAKVDKFKTQVTIAAGVVAAGIALWGKSAIEQAGSLSAALGTTQQIFGAASAKIDAFGATAATTLGQSNRAAHVAANGFAVFAKAAGLSQDAAADFSIRLVKLASDMAAFSDTTPQEAIEAISAALRGENDPIERYGILLNDATVRQEALRLGIIKNTKTALTPQQRILAVNSLLFKQTADAQGQFAREANQLGTTQARLNAEWEDAQAKLGQALLPTAIAFTHALEEGATWLGNHETATKVLVGTVGALAAAILLANGYIATYRTVVVAAEVAQWAWNAAMGAGAISAGGLAVGGIALIIGGLALMDKGLKMSGKNWGDFWGWMVAGAKGAVNGVVWALNKIIGAWNWFAEHASKIKAPGRPDIPTIPTIPEWRAAGGGAQQGRPYWVGEQGPELFIPRSSGTVIPAQRSAAMAGAAGATQVTVGVYLDSRELAAVVDTQIEHSNRETARWVRAANPQAARA